MKLNQFLVGVALCTISSSLFLSCKKQQQESINQNNQEIPQIQKGPRFSGVAPDDQAVLRKIPMIISSNLLKKSINDNTLLASATLRGGSKTPAKDVTAPTVSITSPASGATVSATVTVTVSAADNIGVSSVSLSVDGTAVGSNSISPYTISWNSASVINGTHTLKVTAKDAAGNSASNSIQVNSNTTSGSDITSPTVNITAPSDGSSVSGTVNITAAASDNVGVSSVSYSVDGNVIGSSASSPYTYSFNTATVSTGIHTLTATAKDAAGNMGTNSIQVTVNTTVIPPTTLPSAYQLIMPPVRNQGSEGSCVSFAAVYATRSAEQYYKTKATSYSDGVNLFSPAFVFNQVNLGGTCTSSSVVPSLDLMQNAGVCTWQIMPYSDLNGCSTMPNATQSGQAASFKILSYSTIIAQDQTAIKTMITQNHPLIASVNIDQQFYDATPGFIWKSWTNNSGYHTIALCGYDDAKHAYKAMNSWGTTWGDAGFIWIDYDFFPTVSSYYTYTISL